MMLSWIFELMPLCVVRWLAIRYCERFPIYDGLMIIAQGRPGAYFRVPTEKIVSHPHKKSHEK